MSDSHISFTASPTAYLRSLDRGNREAFAVHFQEAPRQNENGTTSIGLNFPMLIVTAYVAEPQAFAEKVARILEAHWTDEA